MEYTKTFFAWLEDEGVIPKNPFNNLSIPNTGAPRRPFDEKDLANIFSGPLYQGPNHSFWKNKESYHASHWWALPVLLFTGARAGEIAQLSVSDIIWEDDIACISLLSEDINVKTQNARRIIPIHHTLLELGILEYLDKIKESGESKLFPLLSSPKVRAGNERQEGSAIGGWFSEQYRNKVPELQYLKEERKSAHCFRHSFVQSAYQADAQLEKIQQLVGHANSAEGTTRTYKGKGFSAQQMKLEIDKVTFPSVDLELLKKNSWRKAPIFKRVRQ